MRTPPRILRRPFFSRQALTTLLLLGLIVFVGAKIRYFRIDWDEGTQPHPDERFLSMVTYNIQVPRSFSDYMTAVCPPDMPAPRTPADPANNRFAVPSLDSGCSTLNPRNYNESTFFVYGSFPISLTRFVAEKRGMTGGWWEVAFVGRELSAFFDIIALLLVFLIARRLYGRNVGLLAALLYAFTVMPIQQAHFYTTDSFAACFGLLAFYFAVRLTQAGQRWPDVIFSALGLGFGVGMAVASKITLAALVGLAALAALQWAWRNRPRDLPAAFFVVPALALGLFIVGPMTKLTFHLANPDAFASPSLLSLKLDPRLLKNLDEVKAQVTGEFEAPFALQWTNRTPWVFPLRNMLLWGMGLGLGLAAWAGWLAAAWQLLRRNAGAHLLCVAWVGAFFYWQGGQWVKSMRYLLPIYGLLVILAAWALVQLVRWGRERQGLRRALGYGVPALAVLATLLWGWGFSRIYAKVTPRLAAAQWLRSNVTTEKTIAFESWDEGLPHMVYGAQELRPHSVEDEPSKIREHVEKLASSDYIAIVSQRGYGSTMQVPMRYPATNRYYEELFKCLPPDDANPTPCPLGFELAAEFNAHPTFLGMELNDQLAAEEAFSVYDHVRVLIFKKRPDYNANVAYELITSKIAKLTTVEQMPDGTAMRNESWPEVYRLGPIRATNAPTALRMTPDEWAAQQTAGTWSELFGGLFSRWPLLWWVLLLEALGLATFGLLFRLRLPLPDRGLSLARPLGLILVTWVGWALASARLVAYSRPFLALLAVALLLLGGLLLRSQRAELRQFLRERRGAVIASQLVYVLAFALFLLIRYLNPDLWHPSMGGERPMELAYTHAILRSDYFPPYDPWFSGGFMNYYYWGFLLVGTPMKLLGIAPEVGFNLAIPMVYGWTALGAFGVAYNLLAPLRRVVARLERRALIAGCVAPIFLALLGNLAQVPLYVNGLREIGTPEVALMQEPYYKNGLWVDDAPAGIVGPALEGLRALTSSDPQVKQPMPFRPEWPYWNATRVVRDAINEFPFFSFLYGDLHAHVIALPLTLMALILVAGLLRSRFVAHSWPGRTAPWPLLRGFARQELALIWPQIVLVLLLGLVVGALYATNTWDYPTFLGLGAAGLLVAVLLGAGRWDTKVIRLVGLGGLLFMVSKLVALPWASHFVNAYTQAMEPIEGAPLVDNLLRRLGLIRVEPHERMAAREFGVIYGLWGFVLVSYALLLTRRVFQRTGGSGWTAALSVAWLVTLAGAFFALSQGLVFLLLAALPLVFALLFAATLSGVLARRDLGPVALALGGFLILFITDLVVVPGAGRMNTVFKFGYQVWTLLALASALALPSLLGALAWRRLLPPRGSLPLRQLALPLGLVWHAGLAVLVLAALIYPATAAPAKVRDRYQEGLPHTLDGMAFMAQSKQNEEGQDFPLAPDKAAIEWMRANIAGTPIIAEAHLSPYRYGNRIAIWTGLPSVVGWEVHEKQQRAAAQADANIDRRIQALRELYTMPLREVLEERLKTFGIEYIYVGPLERIVYQPDANTAFFDQMASEGVLSLAYNQNDVRIYQVRRPSFPLTLHQPPDFSPPPSHVASKLMLSGAVNEQPVVDGFADTPWSRNQPVSLLLWLLVFELLGLLALPLAALIFGRRRDLGWGWSKLIGLLFWSYLVWLPTSLGVWRYSRGAALLALLLLLALGTWALWVLGRRRLPGVRPGLVGAPLPAPAPLPLVDPDPSPWPVAAAQDERSEDAIFRPRPLPEAGGSALAAMLAGERAPSTTTTMEGDDAPGVALTPASQDDQGDQASLESGVAQRPDETAGNGHAGPSNGHDELAQAEDALTAPVLPRVYAVALDAPVEGDLAPLAGVDEAEPDGNGSREQHEQPAATTPADGWDERPGAGGAGWTSLAWPERRSGDAFWAPLRAGFGWLRGELRARRRTILAVEGIFLAVFAFWVLVRALNPDVWHPTNGGEKPFEFGMLNAILRSPSMPPYDPFYSDGILNYYYYGLFIVSLPVKLLGIDSAIAFNLIVPTIGALIALAALSLVTALTGRLRWGLAGVFTVGFMASLGGVIPLGMSMGLLPIEQLLAGEASELSGQWYWNVSRLIFPQTGLDGQQMGKAFTINEFPYWSLLFADLHPHLIALPLTILVAALAWELAYPRPWRESLWAMVLVPLALGAVAITNSWDLPTYGILLVLALFMRALLTWWRRDHFTFYGWPPIKARGVLGFAGWPLLGVVLIGLGLVLYLPFWARFDPQVGGKIVRVPQQLLSPWPQYLGVFGGLFWLLLPVPILLQRTVSHTWRMALAFVLIATMLLGLIFFPAYHVVVLLVAGFLLICWTMLQPRRSPAVRFALLLAAMGIAVSAGTELVLVQDHLIGDLNNPGEWSRMNTVFKFGFQVWALLALAAAALLPTLLNLLRRLSLNLPIPAFAKFAYGVGAVVLLLCSLIFTLFGPVSRVNDRFQQAKDMGPSLDGLAFMQDASYVANNPYDGSLPQISVNLASDAAAIAWMKENLRGTPIVLASDREFYRAYGVRITANTGLPTVLGRLHEDEQRPASGVYEREQDVKIIYNSGDVDQALRLLGRYRVDYLYVGPVERALFPAESLAKFETMSELETVYNQGEARLYRVQPQVRDRARDPVGDPVVMNPIINPVDDSVVQQALADYNANPTDTGKIFALAVAYRDAGRLDDAVNMLRKGTELAPGDVPMRHVLGDILANAQRFEEAEAAYNEAIAIDPAANNITKLGQFLLERGELDRAEETFKRALETDPANPFGHFFMGELHRRRGDLAAARDEYSVFLGMTRPGDPYNDVAMSRMQELGQ